MNARKWMSLVMLTVILGVTGCGGGPNRTSHTIENADGVGGSQTTSAVDENEDGVADDGVYDTEYTDRDGNTESFSTAMP